MAVLEVVAGDGAALIEHHIVPQRHQLKVTHVQGVDVAPLPDARSLHRRPHHHISPCCRRIMAHVKSAWQPLEAQTALHGRHDDMETAKSKGSPAP